MKTASLSVADLEKILDERKAALQDLGQRRDVAQKALDDIDKQIQELMGDDRSLGMGRRRRRRRPKNEQSLRTVVLEVLKKNKAGLTLAMLADAVVETGYKSNSRNFRNVLYQCLYNTEAIIHDAPTGCYKLKK